MVRAMNLAMTIGTAPVEEKCRIAPARIGRVPTHMTLRTESWVGHFKQAIINRPVRLMTVGTAFENRRMLVEKRSATFGMASVAVLIDAGLFELGGIWRTMRVMAIGTGDFALSERHM